MTINVGGIWLFICGSNCVRYEGRGWWVGPKHCRGLERLFYFPLLYSFITIFGNNVYLRRLHKPQHTHTHLRMHTPHTHERMHARIRTRTRTHAHTHTHTYTHTHPNHGGLSHTYAETPSDLLSQYKCLRCYETQRTPSKPQTLTWGAYQPPRRRGSPSK